MELILIRHTTPKIEKGICYGWLDIDVTDTFESKTVVIGKKLPKDSSAYAVYSSPLQRCKQLATTLFDTVNYDERLKELHFGDWEGKKWDDINQEELGIWMKDFDTIPTTGGESYEQLYKRTSDFIEDIKKEQKNTIVVTHAGVIRSINAYLNNIPLKKSFDLKVSYGQVLHYKL